MSNLLGIPETRLPFDPAATQLSDGMAPRAVAAAFPASPLAWAVLAEDALEDERIIDAYACARNGAPRSRDAIPRGGWNGQRPVPGPPQAHPAPCR